VHYSCRRPVSTIVGRDPSAIVSAEGSKHLMNGQFRQKIGIRPRGPASKQSPSASREADFMEGKKSLRNFGKEERSKRITQLIDGARHGDLRRWKVWYSGPGHTCYKTKDNVTGLRYTCYKRADGSVLILEETETRMRDITAADIVNKVIAC